MTEEYLNKIFNAIKNDMTMRINEIYDKSYNDSQNDTSSFKNEIIDNIDKYFSIITSDYCLKNYIKEKFII